MREPVPPVLAISPANHALHVGGPAVLLAHVTAERPDPGGDVPAIEWEYFDATGRSLAVADDPAGRPALTPAEPDGEPPAAAALQILVSRVDLVLAHAQLRLDELLAKGGGPGPDDRTRMVRVQGEFRDVLAMLAALEPDLVATPQDPHQGSWFHNLWDAAFG